MNKKQLFIAVLVSVISCGLQAMMDNGYVKPEEQTRPSEQERQDKREKRGEEQRDKKDRKGSKAFFF